MSPAAALRFLLFAVGACSAVAEELPPDVTLRLQGHGAVLADAKGMTLYTYLTDPKAGPPTCDQVCLDEGWTPLIASGPPVVAPDWGVVTRDDKTVQRTFRGKPLYRYGRDTNPGDMFGDDVGQKWALAFRPAVLPPGFEAAKTPLGHLLTDSKRMSVYAPVSADTACDGSCLQSWRPVEAWWTAVANLPNWSVATRADGTRQWAFKGKPLYRYDGDSAPGEVEGARVAGWAPVILEPPLPNPKWVTINMSDSGELLGDADGRTLYVHNLTRIKPGYSRVWEVPHMWQPVLAAETDASVGQWSIITRADGKRQWTFKGMDVYTFVRDRAPGEIHGTSNTDRVWQTIMASGQAMPGAVN